MKNDSEDSTRKYRMKKRAREANELGNRILDAAFERFSTTHFVDVTVASIAEAAGCSAQTIYRRYDSKEGLFRTLADRVGEEVRGGRQESAPDVETAVSRVMHDYEASGDAMILLQAQEDQVDVIAEVVERGREHHHEWVSRTFEDVLEGLPPGARTRMHGQLVVALDVQTWKRLRRDLSFSAEDTAGAMTEFIRAILTARDQYEEQEET